MEGNYEDIQLSNMNRDEDTSLSDTSSFDSNESDRINKCRLFGTTPDCIQFFNCTKWALFFLGMAAFIQGAIVNGMIHFFITTIEKRFEMPSYQSGLMSGAFDMASMIFLIPVTYLGGRVTANKPRWISTGTLIVAIGSFVFSSPQFIAGCYKVKNITDICINDEKNYQDSNIKRWISSKSPSTSASIYSSFSLYFWILFLGNFLHGIGGTPLFTLCIAFIDESVPKTKSSLYLGLYYFLALLGPSLGYALGGFLIRLNVDWPRVKNSELELFPNSPTWVGNWWLGFIICGFGALIISFVIYSMPKEVKGSRKVKESKRKGNEPIPYQTLGELPKAFKTLLTNSVYMCVVAVGYLEGFVVSGFGAFMPKILEKEFNLSSQMVAIVMGMVALPSALLGLVLGGWLINYLKLGLEATIKLGILLFVLSMFCIPALLIGCPNETLIGINHPYNDDKSDNDLSQNYSLLSQCNKDCSCSDIFSPVCGSDNKQYFSACFAGCHRSGNDRSSSCKVYFECGCIPKEKYLEGKPEATSDPCKTDCPLFPVYLSLFFIYQLLTFTAAVPAISVMLRTVNVNLKSLALGLQWILSRLLGTIPGPVVFGAIMDYNCLYWYSSQNISKGACLLYNHVALRIQLALVVLVWKICQILIFFLALVFIKRRPLCFENDDEETLLSENSGKSSECSE